MNPRALLKATASAFRNAGIPDPEVDAALLLSHVTGQPPLSLRLDMTTVLSDDVLTRFDALVSRRLTRQPLQYLLHTQPFLGRDFYVDERVLIPRPETEEMVRRIVDRYKGRSGMRILDVGTGSGCIAVTLAAELPDAEVTGIDVSETVLAVAGRNGSLCGGRVRFECCDILTRQPGGRFDLVVSNPPYVTLGEKAGMRPNILKHEPHRALFVGDDDPLLFYRVIAERGRSLLAPGGALWFEINERFGDEVTALLGSLGYADVKLTADLFGKPRITEAVWK